MKYLFFAAGVVLSSLAVFSVQFGLDNDSGWGQGRLTLLVFGVLSLGLGGVVHFFGGAVVQFVNRLNAFMETKVNRFSRVMAVALASMGIVLFAYFWFVELDRREAGYEFEYYIELAKSFKNGQLHLEVEPPADLLALENPYDYFLRRQNNVDDFPWDLSLYGGKFYIYWGPTAALFAALLSRDLLNRLGDFHLALAFACGLFIYQALLIAAYWRKHLKFAPAWFLGILLLVVGLIAPVPLILNGAKVSEVAIFSCQFFLIGGCFWAYLAFLDESPSIWKLVLASIHWVLSIGSRVIVLPGVFMCAGLALYFLYGYYKEKGIGAFAPAFIRVALPFVIGGGAMAWYNQARFDSIFEFGLTYQLASADYTNFKDVFSASRIPFNAWLYLTHPLSVKPRFPYLAPIEYVNSNERLAGLVFTAPYFFLLAVSVVQWIGGVFASRRTPPTPTGGRGVAESWLSLSLLGSGLISTAIIFSYYHPAMRFVEDFMSPLAIFITIQAGSQYDALQGNPSIRRIFTGSALILAGITIAANTLLAAPVDGIKFAVNFLNDIYKLIGLK